MNRLREYFPLTAAGTGLLAMTLASTWVVGAGESDLILLVGGFTILAYLLATVGLVVLGAFLARKRVLETERHDTPLVLQVGCELPTEFCLRVPGWLPFLQFSWQWDSPQTAEIQLQASRNRVTEIVKPARRGEFLEIQRRFVVRDNIHLSEIAFPSTQTRQVQIFPSAGAGHQLSYLHNLVSGDEIPHPKGDPAGDRVDMRQYTKGDSPRTILWKVFARSRKLMVKVPERALAAQPRACCYLVTGHEDEGAAGVARDIVESDLLGEGWRFGVDGAAPACNRADSLLALMRSGDKELWQKPSDLPEFVARAARDGYGCCFVLTGPDAPDERLQRVRQTLETSPLRVVLCLVIDGLVWDRPTRFRRLIRSDSGRSGLELDELEALWNFWSAGRVEARLVDRSSGEVYRDVGSLLKALRSRQND
ncbi:MAG: DUF58 domain-containing protein [Candidatus Eremiobacteraeota bacterium]|nr:DUF58 domain-containing protein [Candidatus Eremiobacteraeota bacterium]